MLVSSMWALGSTTAAAALVGLAVLGSSVLPHVQAVTPVTAWEPAFATFYGGQPDGLSPYQPSFGTSVGSCGFGLLQQDQYPFWSVGALATANHFFQNEPQNACGECFEVQCLESGPLGAKPGSCQSNPNNRSIVVQITDSCPECGANHLDLQALTWAKIAQPSPSGGRINIQYRRVECAPPTDLIVDVSNNLGDGRWLKLHIESTGGPANVKEVEVRSSSGGSWQQCNNVYGANYELPQSPTPPMDVRITAQNSQKVVATRAIQAGQAGNLPTNVQFRVADPSDVQPSGQVLSAAESSTPPSSSQVSAFEGPPDSSAPAGSSSSPPAPGGNDTSPPSSPFAPSPPKSSPPSGPPPSPAAPPSVPSAELNSAGGSSAPSPGCTCSDQTPDASFSCADQKAQGHCSQWFLRAGKYCQKTCGNCADGCPGTAAVADSSAQDSSGKGRRRLHAFN